MVQLHGGPTAGLIPGSQWQNAAIIDGAGALRVYDPSGAVNVGSQEVYGTVGVSGSIVIGSVSASVDSIYIQSGANIDLGSAWTNTGSVVISGGVVGSVAVTTGSLASYITNLGSTAYVTVVAGSIQPYNQIGVGSVRIAEQGLNLQVYNSGAFNIVGSLSAVPGMGSVAITTNPLPISGNIGVIFDSDYLNVVQSGVNWGVSGNINLVGGSVRIMGVSGGTSMPLLVTSGTEARLEVNINSGSIAVTTTNLGSVRIASDPVPISGAVNQAGTWNINNLTTGSVRVVSQADTTRQITAGSIKVMGASGGDFYPLLVTSGTIGILRTDINSWPGSVAVTTTNLGSVRIISDPVPVSGFVTGSVALTTGSVNIYGTLSASSPSVYAASGIIANTGSVDLVGAHYNGSVWALRMANGSALLVDIGAIGSVEITNTNLGSVRIANIPSVIGSVAVTTGSINIYGNITASPASDYALSGIITNTGSVSLVGGHYNGSAWALRLANGSNLLVETIGSVRIASTTLGSVYVLSDPVPVSGGIIVRAGSIQTYTPLGIGSVLLAAPTVYAASGIIANTGSLTLMGAHYGGSVWSLRLSNGSHLFTQTIGSVNIASTTLGSVYILSNPVPVSGLINQGAPPWLVNGSIRQLEEPWKVEQIRGVFRASGISAFAGSFTGSNFITPGAGSLLFMKGFTASAELATKFRLFFSGGTSTAIGTWILPNSGTMALNFMGMEPSGATNQPLAYGAFNAGSIHITAYTRDSL